MVGRTVAFGKIGRAISFNPSKWKHHGGDYEPPMLLVHLARLNPDDTFVVCSRTDIDKCPEHIRSEVPANVIFPFSEADTPKVDSSGNPSTSVFYEHLLRWFKERDIVPDKGVFIAGPVTSCNIPDFLPKVTDPSKRLKGMLMFSVYSAPIIALINEFDFPYDLIVPDLKYHPLNARDIQRPPERVLTQVEEDYVQKWRDVSEGGTQKTWNLRAEYAAIETLYLLGKDPWWKSKEPPPSNLDGFFGTEEKADEFVVVLNQGPAHYRRDRILKEYILDSIDNVKIIGSWADEFYEDPRFVGPMNFSDLQRELSGAKYSFIASVSGGWGPTAKWCELLHNGIIGFMDPQYDEKRLCGLPAWMWINSADEMKKVMNYIEGVVDREKVVEKLQRDHLTEDLYSGELMNRIIMGGMSIDEARR